MKATLLPLLLLLPAVGLAATFDELDEITDPSTNTIAVIRDGDLGTTIKNRKITLRNLASELHQYPEASSFSLVFIPDMQDLSEGTETDTMEDMADWIIANQTAWNIQAVIGLGDIVDSATAAQFQASTNLWYRLTGADVLCLPIVGNHDYDDVTARTLTDFNTYYPETWLTNQTRWSGSLYSSTDTENAMLRIPALGTEYLVFGLEFAPRDAVMEWAVGLMTNNPASRVIVATHSYLYGDGYRSGSRSSTYHYNLPSTYSITGTYNNGEQLWDRWLRDIPSLVTVASGHHLLTARVPWRNVSFGGAGNPVLEWFANYQDETGFTDENGYMRILTVAVDGNVTMRTVQADGTFTTTDPHQFAVNLSADARRGERMQGSLPLTFRDDSLIFYSPMDEPAGGNAFVDLVSGNIGTNTGAGAIVNGTYGVTGNRVAFNQGVVVFPFHPRLVGWSNLTVSAWVKTTDEDFVVASVNNGSTDGAWVVAITNAATTAKIATIKTGPTRQDLTWTITAVNDDAWHHLVWTWEGEGGGSAARFYVDGAYQGPNSAQTGPLRSDITHPLVINGYAGDLVTHVDGYAMLTGDMDEIAVWNRRLYEGEIVQIFTAQRQSHEALLGDTTGTPGTTGTPAGWVKRTIDGAVYYLPVYQ